MQVTLTVKSDSVEAFKAATIANAQGSRGEPGNVRYEVYQHAETPTEFTLVEVYQDEDAMNAHFQTAHFQAWREATADMFDGNGSSKKLVQVFP